MISSLHSSVSFFFPGYVRLKIDRLKKNAEFGKILKDNLLNVYGINTVDFNILTGSLLVKYNPKTVDVDQLIKVGVEIELIPENHTWDIESVRKILRRGFP